MKLICVSGSSGVGKTTLTKLIESVIGSDNAVCLSGDDLHLWERNDPMWNTYTHLNPKANDLETGHAHIDALKSGQTITRRHYNHDTGKFDPPITIEPKPYVIYEGLHALYYADTSAICIFVDTDDDLKTESKVKRESKKRG
jgi:uridine kinase